MKKIISLLFVAFSVAAFAQSEHVSYLRDDSKYREHPIDMVKMKVELNFLPKEGTVLGKVSHQFIVIQKKVDSIFFDAPSIEIKSARLNNQQLNFTKVATGIWVKPAQPLRWDEKATITFEYTATPQKGIYFIGWNAAENMEQNAFAVRKQIWTQGQGIDNRHWIPMYDDMNDKMLTETIVTFDKNYEVLSNGNLKSKSKNNDNTITWHYAMTKPHAGYLLMLGIGHYDIMEKKSKSGVPLHLYYYPGFEERAEYTYKYSARLIDFMERETGVKYPWESYSQIMVQDFMYGAMENTTATIFGDFFNVDARAYADRNYIGVNCHELTHQWFGDCITARDSRDAWLQESFATYYPKMFTLDLLGEDEYDWQRRGEHNIALAASKNNLNPIRGTAGGSSRIYQKGSSVISMFTYILGEEQWKKALKIYLQKHAYANVETNDLKQSIQDVLGLDMSWFFDQWLYRGGEPEYTVSYESLAAKGAQPQTMVFVNQTHKRDNVVGLFKMPINIEVYYTDGSSDKATEWIDKESQIIRIANNGNKEIAFVLFDPNSQILKTVVFAKSWKELQAQALHAPNMLDRYDALVAMKTTPIAQKRATLLQVLGKEKFHQIHAEIVRQLINDAESAIALQLLFNKEESSPKLAAINGLSINLPSWKSTLENALQDKSYAVVEAALVKLCSTYIGETEKNLAKTKDVMGMSNSVNIKWHEMAASYTTNKQASLDRLVYYASNAWEFRTRTDAFAALKSVGYCNDQLIANLFDAMLTNNGRLAGPAAQLAAYFTQQTAFQNQFAAYFQAHEWQPWQSEKLKRQMGFL